MNAEKILDTLPHFTGTEEYTSYKALTKQIYLTQGVDFIVDEAQCYWLVDAVLSHQIYSYMQKEDFQVWELKKFGEKWLLEANDGNGNILVRQFIEFSDFPLDYAKFYFINNLLMLPTEY